MEIENFTEAATFLKFSSPKLWKHNNIFFVTALFNYFHEPNINWRFLGLDKNKNCAFPVKGLLKGVVGGSNIVTLQSLCSN